VTLETVAGNQVVKGLGTPDEITYKTATMTPNGQLETVTDAEGNTTTYTYDGHDRLKMITFPDGTADGISNPTFETYAYDADGNNTSKITRAGQTITTTYDWRGNITTATNSGGLPSFFTYDILDRPVSDYVWNGVDGVFEGRLYTYDVLGRLTRIDYDRDTVRSDGDASAVPALAFQYDDAGNRTRTTWHPNDTAPYYVTYDYDRMNRMTAIREHGTSALATYSYDRLSRLTTLTYGNGTSTSYTYELDDDMTGLQHSFLSSAIPGASTAPQFTYAYSKVSQLVSKTASDAGYVYDIPTGSMGTETYAVNALNQYTSVDDGTGPQTLSYDLNGNLTGDGSSTYTYDSVNQLREVDLGAGETWTYDYFAGKQRFRKTQRLSNVVQHQEFFLHDDTAHVLGRYDSGTGPNSADLLQRFVQGPGTDRPVVMIDYSGSGAPEYRNYHHDRQGNVIALSDASGALVERYTYDAFGRDGQTLSGNPIRYTGRWLDFESGLYFYRARYYSTELGVRPPLPSLRAGRSHSCKPIPSATKTR